MVETFQAKYVSLHVRVSNAAARHLYEDTLKFKNEKTESKYYADGEDAFCMRLDLDTIKDSIKNDEDEDDEDAEKKKKNGEEAVDEGDAVGEVGRDPNAGKKDEGRKMKVAVGRGLGVGELVEKDESKH